MAFCTQLEWDHEFPFERYEAMTMAAGSHGVLPEGCLPGPRTCCTKRPRALEAAPGRR